MHVQFQWSGNFKKIFENIYGHFCWPFLNPKIIQYKLIFEKQCNLSNNMIINKTFMNNYDFLRNLFWIVKDGFKIPLCRANSWIFDSEVNWCQGVLKWRTSLHVLLSVNFTKRVLSIFFRRKVICAAFLCLKFKLMLLWRKIIGRKAGPKMLVKLTPAILLHNAACVFGVRVCVCVCMCV